MSEIKNDPSNLYDEEFMRKREEMFGADSDADEISSGREFEDEDDSDESGEDAFNEGGLFSRFKKKSKTKKKKSRRKKEEEDDDEEGYDIFDIEIEPKKKAKPVVPESKESADKKSQAAEKAAERPASIEEMAAKVLEEAFSVEQEEEPAAAAYDTESVFEEEIQPAEALISEADEAAYDEEVQVIEEVTEEVIEEITEEAIEEVAEEELEEVAFEDDFAAEGFYAGEDLDDINALLESVGIMPLGKKAEKAAAPEAAPVAEEEEEDIKIADFSKPSSEERPDGKTKFFGAAKEKAAPEKKDPEGEEKNTQMILDGYVDEQPYESTSEEEVEEKLKITRKRLIDNFRVLSKGTEDRTILEKNGEGKKSSSITENVEVADGEGIFDAVDKAGKKVSAFLKKGEKVVKSAQQRARKERKKEQSVSIQVLGKTVKEKGEKKVRSLTVIIVLTALMLLFSLLSKAYNPGGALDFFYGFGARAYTAVSLVLLALCVVFSFDGFKKTVESFRDFRPDEGAGVLTITVCAVLQALIALIGGLNEEKGFTLYCAFAGFAIICYQYGEICNLSVLQRNIKMLQRSGSLSGIQSVSNKADALALGSGMAKKGDPEILYGTDMTVPGNAMTISLEKASDEKLYSYSTVAVMVTGFIFSLVYSIVKKDASHFATIFAGFVCLCTPIMRRIVVSKLHEDANVSLASYSAVIMGVDACNSVGKANAVAVDMGDIFEASVSKFRVVPGSKMAQSDAVVFAAATLKETRCLLSSCFDDFIREMGIRLPEAEDLTYEEGLGYTAWVAARKILVGNREMLKAHSIECPSLEDEQRYSKGRTVLYVVVEGMIAATFIADYAVKGENKKSIRNLKKSGIVLMLNSAEPGFNESVAAAKLGVDITAIKIISSKGGEILNGYKNSPLSKEDNGLLCSKKKKSLVQLVNVAHRLYQQEKLSLILAVVGIVLGFVALVFCAGMNISAYFAVITIMIMQTVWAAVAYFVSKNTIR